MNDQPQILQVLMSLFNDLPYLEEEDIRITDSQELLSELQKSGLKDQSLERAFVWLEQFTKLDERTKIGYQPDTVRVFTNAEKAVIPVECLGFLLEAHHLGEIQSHELEFIIEQIMTLSTHAITEEQFLWVFDMTLANQMDDSMDVVIGIHKLPGTSLYIH
ncbi:DUF494 family protein [Caedibacter taeniospiralis]|jgi:Smg protein|uniref:DUF494 family protein n=1 Tax=Caedibacter taeniospiralis TaxID=28907 RepID=UPI0037BF2CAF